jgi:hypothetical protein
MSADVVRVDEVMRRLDCSSGKAYRIIKQLNSELKAKGFITIAGRVPRSYFEQKCRIGGGVHGQDASRV